jgi:hypothetical protein
VKTILLWDMRFPERRPSRLTVADAVASACVRAGVAAAADPAESGTLASGAAISAANLVEMLLQHGVAGQRLSRVALPLAVAQVAVAAGLAAVPAGGAIIVSIPLAALLGEDGTPLLSEDGINILPE